MKKAFEAIHEHLGTFIADGDMCPFNPHFMKEETAPLASSNGREI
jgi:hypothetical protein